MSGWRARTASTSISLSVVPRYSIVVRGITSRSPICACGLLATVGLDEPDDDVGAALLAATAFAEHREGLADAWRGAEVDPQRAARHGSVCQFRADVADADHQHPDRRGRRSARQR